MKEYWIDARLNMSDMVSHSCTPSLVAKSAFFYLQSFGHFYCDKEYYTKREGYRSFLLLYTISGAGCVLYRGKSYEIKPGQVLFMDCSDYQEYRTDSIDLWHFKWIHFNGSTSSEYFSLVYSRSGPVIDIKGSLRLPECLDEIIDHAGKNDFQLEVNISRLIVEMLSELLLCEMPRNDELKPGFLNENIKSALEYVENNHDRAVSLKEMASAACCSEYHFSRVFKRATGYSPYEYLVKYRINRAKHLLKHSNNTVEEIAGLVGFESISNFIRTFKHTEEITPLKYRKFWTG